MEKLKSLWIAYGSREVAIGVIISATNELRKHYVEEENVNMSEKAFKLQSILRGSASPFAELFAQLVSVIIDETITAKQQVVPIPFVPLAAVIPTVPLNGIRLGFMLVPKNNNGSVQLLGTNSIISDEYKLLKKNFSPANDEQIINHINMIYDQYESESERELLVPD